MRTTALAVSLPWHLWEELDEDNLVNGLRNRFEVYVNHEDSDFPFKLFSDDKFRVDRGKAIGVDIADFRERGGILSFSLVLTLTLRRVAPPKHGSSKKIKTRTVKLRIDRESGGVEAIICD